MHERGEDPRGVADGADTTSMDKKGRCSEEIRVDVDMRQGSALSPLLFITVVEEISRKVQVDVCR